jgi:uncharacterized phage protein (TIGR02218 family)
VTTAGTVAASPAPTVSTVAISGSFAADYFRGGGVAFTTGPCAGVRRTVTASANSGGAHVLTLAVALPAAPAAGNAATVTRGCDKLRATCTAFGNLTRFRGFPWVPPPEEAA